MARNRLPWFPIDPVEMMTDRRFSTLDDAQHGRALRGAYYLWVYGQWPGDGSAESEKLRLLVQPWLNSIKEAQERRFDEASKRNSANAKLGWNKALDASRSQLHASGYHREVEVDIEVDKKLTTTPLPPKGAGYGFDDFWKAYPRKTGKGIAEKWWNRNKPNQALLQAMLGALEWQRISPDWKRENGKYIPHPSTWLNGKRWEDEPANGSKSNSVEEKGDARPPEPPRRVCSNCGQSRPPYDRSWRCLECRDETGGNHALAQPS